MRISDWSSDVCSSDLHAAQRVAQRQAETALERFGDEGRLALAVAAGLDFQVAGLFQFLPVPDIDSHGLPFAFGGTGGGRSEEHTSELQSQMRISYAVFCLKKKKQKTPRMSRHTQPSLTNNKNKPVRQTVTETTYQS